MDELARNGAGYFDPTAYSALSQIRKEERQKMMIKTDIKRGDIFYVTHGSTKPAVVITNDDINASRDFIGVVFCSKENVPESNMHVPVMTRTSGYAICERMTYVTKDKLGDYIKTCTEKEMDGIDAALSIALALSDERNEQRVDEYKAKLEVLVNELECAERACETMREERDEAANRADSFGAKLEAIKLRFSEKESPDKIAIERDMYKVLYEQLLEKIVR